MYLKQQSWISYMCHYQLRQTVVWCSSCTKDQHPLEPMFHPKRMLSLKPTVSPLNFWDCWHIIIKFKVHVELFLDLKDACHWSPGLSSVGSYHQNDMVLWTVCTGIHIQYYGNPMNMPFLALGNHLGIFYPS